ncbi:MAG TPA: hypothetical protein VLA49_03550, partial [Anaerolineales bacterium]|nr:hypothetical protein [Anaerolineales bacterium]
AAIEQQAQEVGLRFEPGLALRILNEVEGEPGAMPLLQHALLLLWERRHGRWLKYAEYADFGGVGEAIADTAEKAYGSLSDFERQRVQDIFTRLTRLDDSEGEAPRHTRRRVRLSELVPAGSDPTATAALVKGLADARLVATGLKAGTEEQFVEVAHEALISRWPRLVGWLREDQASLRLREGIRQAALEWQAADQDDTLLVHRGGRLEEAETLAQAGSLPLNQTELDYLSHCVERRQRERAAREQRARRTVITAVTIAIVMAILSGLSLVFARQRDEQARIALGRQLSAQVQLLLTGPYPNATNITRSALLAVEAGRRAPGLEADQALRRALPFTSFELARMEHVAPATSISFSPDGQLAISGGDDGSARVWEARTGAELVRLQHDDPVTSVAFSPDGELAISGSADGSARVWYWRIEDLINEICRRLSRNLTEEEGQQYLGDEPYRPTCPNLPVPEGGGG